jgi:hypothetical protein
MGCGKRLAHLEQQVRATAAIHGDRLRDDSRENIEPLFALRIMVFLPTFSDAPRAI